MILIVISNCFLIAEILPESDMSLFDVNYRMTNNGDENTKSTEKNITKNPKKRKLKKQNSKATSGVEFEKQINEIMDTEPQSGNIIQGESHDNLQCKICLKTFSRQNHLKRHTKEVHTEGPRHSCLTCNAQFKRKDALNRHVKLNTDESGNMTCNKPNKPTPGEGKQSLQCDICQKIFSAPTHLRRHKKEIHSDLRWFTCPVCDATFKRMNSMKKHLQYHTDEGGNINLDNSNRITNCYCDKCDKTFQKKIDQVKHMRQVHLSYPRFIF